MPDNKRLVIIDGNSLINRAYYAIQRPMITKEGVYTQGIYGFITMLQKILADYEPAYIAVAWDRKAPTFRHEEYAEYKAGRHKMPIELAMELPYMKDVLSAMNIEMLETDGFEADDIIGTVAKRGEEAGLEPLIITGDRDALQLASDMTKVIITKRGISEFEIYDEDAMVEKYGFTPTQFIDYKGLMGDSSDNIPGIPGVGEKTASKLILEYGSVEKLIESASEISSQKLREKVEDNATLALMSKRLATIVTDVPIETDFDKMRRVEPDLGKLIPLYKKLEFNSFLKKMSAGAAAESSSEGSAGAADGKASGGADDPKESGVAALLREASAGGGAEFFNRELPRIIISDPDAMGKLAIGLAAAAESGAPVAMKVLGDNNHRAAPCVYGVCLMTDSAYFYVNTENDHALLPLLMDTMRDGAVKVIGHDLQQGVYMLMAAQAAGAAGGKGGESSDFAYVPDVVFDTAIAQYLLEPSASNYSIKRLALEYFGVEVQDDDEFYKSGAQLDMLADQTAVYAEYGLSHCRAVRSLHAAILPRLEDEGLTDVYSRAELPLIAPLAAMETEGFDFDKDALTKVGETISEGVAGLTEEIYGIAGEEFNINSPQQLGIILFEKLQLSGAKKTKTGYATGAEILEKLADEHPIARKVLEYRTLVKLRGTYIDGLIPLVAADGRIHAHFRQTVTATGRISCTEPNLQNIPIRQEFGRQIRKAFVPGEENHVLLGADYSQIELRILAHFSGDPSLIEDFRQGADIHRRTAARVFGVANEAEVTAAQRSGAKAVNFGIIYGMSSFGLSEGLGIARAEAESYINEYFAAHRAVKEYLDASVESAKESGYAETLLGRKRFIPELKATNYMTRQLGERLAMNTPIQGSAADIMKLAMIAVYDGLRERGLRSRVILQVHDELIIRAHIDELDEVSAVLKEKMESAYELAVPLVADMNTGANWYELK
ncbi:MAG: DNA polymerase I [Clostridiales Family XIII bacterium]|jgi:DNA polymerase-1|nr:DNA polymerase I [Clostridiales Family XIII bacterium]